MGVIASVHIVSQGCTSKLSHARQSCAIAGMHGAEFPQVHIMAQNDVAQPCIELNWVGVLYNLLASV